MATLTCHCGESYEFERAPEQGDVLVCEACDCYSVFDKGSWRAASEGEAAMVGLMRMKVPSGPLGTLLRQAAPSETPDKRLALMTIDKYNEHFAVARDVLKDVMEILNARNVESVAGGMLGVMLIRQVLRRTGMEAAVFCGMITSKLPSMLPEEFVIRSDRPITMTKGEKGPPS